jgi:hypothetical protein
VLTKVLWRFVRDGNQAPLSNEGVRVEEGGRVNKRTMRVFGPEALEDCRRVAGFTYHAVDQRWFGSIVGIA